MPDFSWSDYFAAPRYFHRGGSWGVHVISALDGFSAHTWLGTEYALVLVTGHHIPASLPLNRPAPRAKQPSAGGVMNLFDLSKKRTHRLGTTTVADLRRAFGVPAVPPDDVEGDCPECNGSGIWTCYTCDTEHDCEECDGSGTTIIKGDGADPVHLDIGGALIDNRVAAPLVAGLPDGDVTVFGVAMDNGEVQRLVLVGDGWKMIVMALVSETRDGKEIVTVPLTACEVEPVAAQG